MSSCIAQYCTVVASSLKLFLTELFTILALSKLSKRFGLILRFGLLFTKDSEELIAGTILVTEPSSLVL
jgi:hypothetical protein